MGICERPGAYPACYIQGASAETYFLFNTNRRKKGKCNIIYLCSINPN